MNSNRHTTTTTNSEIAVVTAAPFCCQSGIKTRFNPTFTNADIVVAFKFNASFPNGTFMHVVITPPVIAKNTDTARICNESVAAMNFSPERMYTMFLDKTPSPVHIGIINNSKKLEISVNNCLNSVLSSNVAAFESLGIVTM